MMKEKLKNDLVCPKAIKSWDCFDCIAVQTINAKQIYEINGTKFEIRMFDKTQNKS